MNSRFFFISSCIGILFLSACSFWGKQEIQGSGNVAKEERTVSNFNEIDVRGFGTLFLSQGEKESLTIEADDNLLPYLESKIVDSSLHIGPKKNVNLTTKNLINYFVTVKDIKSISQRGSIALEASHITADTLKLSATGSSSIRVGITAQNLVVDAAGSSKIDISGTVKDQQLNLSGSGAYNAQNLISESCTLTAAGSAKVELNCSKEIIGGISGAGKLSYKGNPQVNVTQAGAVSVRKID